MSYVIMNNLPNEVLRNIINYTGESAKFINSRFYEIALDYEWGYKLIDLSTITIEELKKYLNIIKYIKVIVTKDRSRDELIELIEFLFYKYNFNLRSIYIKIPLDFKSNDEIKLIKSKINQLDISFKSPPILFHTFCYNLKSKISDIKTVIIDISEYSEAFDIDIDKKFKHKILSFIDFFVCLVVQDKTKNFIYIKYNFNLRHGDFIVYNCKEMYADNSYSLNSDCDVFEITRFHSIVYQLTRIYDKKIYLWTPNQDLFFPYYEERYKNLIPNINKKSLNDVLIEQFNTDDLHKILKLK